MEDDRSGSTQKQRRQGKTPHFLCDGMHLFLYRHAGVGEETVSVEDITGIVGKFNIGQEESAGGKHNEYKTVQHFL